MLSPQLRYALCTSRKSQPNTLNTSENSFSLCRYTLIDSGFLKSRKYSTIRFWPCLVLPKKMFPLCSLDWFAAKSAMLVIIIRHRCGIPCGIDGIIKHCFSDAFYRNPMNNGVTIRVNANAMRINISSSKKSGNFNGVYNILKFNKTPLIVVPVFPNTPKGVTNFWFCALHELFAYFRFTVLVLESIRIVCVVSHDRATGSLL